MENLNVSCKILGAFVGGIIVVPLIEALLLRCFLNWFLPLFNVKIDLSLLPLFAIFILIALFRKSSFKVENNKDKECSVPR